VLLGPIMYLVLRAMRKESAAKSFNTENAENAEHTEKKKEEARTRTVR